MSKRAFEKIMEGLTEALAVARTTEAENQIAALRECVKCLRASLYACEQVLSDHQKKEVQRILNEDQFLRRKALDDLTEESQKLGLY